LANGHEALSGDLISINRVLGETELFWACDNSTDSCIEDLTLGGQNHSFSPLLIKQGPNIMIATIIPMFANNERILSGIVKNTSVQRVNLSYKDESKIVCYSIKND